MSKAFPQGNFTITVLGGHPQPTQGPWLSQAMLLDAPRPLDETLDTLVAATHDLAQALAQALRDQHAAWTEPLA